MGKRERQRLGKAKNSESEEDAKSKKFVFSDSDDEANADLSLKIVEKAISRYSSAVRRRGEPAVVVERSELVGEVESIVTTELVDGGKKSRKEKKEKKKKKVKKIEDEALQSVNVFPEGQNTETVKESEEAKSSEQDDVANTENAVFRRLLRGPRYFDPAENVWGTCYNCGEEGHVAASCKSARRKKPCYVCGSFEHQAKECQKGKNCFICNKSGHRSRDCKEKFKKCSQASESCLKCGLSGHVMSLCNKDYSLDDLKEIQCYVCKSTGHLCCANYFGTVPSEMSCYKCGQLGHTGLACRRVSNRETGGDSTPSSCFKCGLEGHFARECSSSVKVKKRSYEMSTPKRKSSREDTYNKGYKSAPQEKGNLHKKKKIYFDEENIASSSKSRGGWIPWDDVHNEDFPRGKGSENNRWESRYENGYSSGRYSSDCRSLKRFNSPYKTPNSKSSRNGAHQGHSPNSKSSRNGVHQGHSSPWFGNGNSYGEYRRHNDRY